MAKKSKHPLQELREALGLKRPAFAEAIGRTRPFVAMVESGDTNLGRDTVLVLFDLYRDTLNQLGITAEDLLRGTRQRAAAGRRRGKGAAGNPPDARGDAGAGEGAAA